MALRVSIGKKNKNAAGPGGLTLPGLAVSSSTNNNSNIDTNNIIDIDYNESPTVSLSDLFANIEMVPLRAKKSKTRTKTSSSSNNSGDNKNQGTNSDTSTGGEQETKPVDPDPSTGGGQVETPPVDPELPDDKKDPTKDEKVDKNSKPGSEEDKKNKKETLAEDLNSSNASTKQDAIEALLLARQRGQDKQLYGDDFNPDDPNYSNETLGKQLREAIKAQYPPIKEPVMDPTTGKQKVDENGNPVFETKDGITEENLDLVVKRRLEELIDPAKIEDAAGEKGALKGIVGENGLITEENLNKTEDSGYKIFNHTDFDSYSVPYVNEFGETIFVKVNGDTKDEINKLLEELANNPSKEREQEIKDKIKKLQKKFEKKAEQIYASGVDEYMKDYEDYNKDTLTAWDPRLARADSFFFSNGEGDGKSGKPKDDQAAIIVPMSTITAAASFKNLVFDQPRAFASKFQEKAMEMGWITPESLGADMDMVGGKYIAPDTDSYETTDNASSNVAQQGMSTHLPYHPGAIPIAFNTGKYYSEPGYYGTAALMNYYALTTLIGGLDGIQMKGIDGYKVKENYMYDVRDQRRFYGLTITDHTVTDSSGVPHKEQEALSVSCPSISNIIRWSNADKWGRTPYQYQDFVYSKWFGLIPNNRLLTLRRYHAPVADNIQFDGMEKPHGAENARGFTATGAFVPRCTVVTYIGDETGNKFSELLKFSSGIAWKDAESKIWDVTGDEGDDPQGKIDEMFEGGGFGNAECGALVGKVINLGSTLTAKTLSLTKFTGMMNGSINTGMSQGAFDNLSKANKDPYADDTFENRIIGPMNRINTVKRRDEKITFEQSFTIKCTYKARAIGGINPKAAMLDILANCMEMVSADALFWGGGHRFNIRPKLYPYHDGGMRDSFMKKLFDGKLFGSGGVIDSALSGLKSFATGGGKSIWENLTSAFSEFWGNAMGALGSVLGSITGSLFGENTGGALSNFFDGLSDNKAATEKGKTMMTNLGNNLNKMWKNKVMEKTAVPEIKGMASLLTGEPVGEWHLTVGNPLNPIMVVGNLICEKMDVTFSDELGPDDFPEEMEVSYSLQHGMPRDKSAIQSMFNRGMGKIYQLPDYIKGSSDFETKVDHYTGGRTAFRKPEWINGASFTNSQIAAQYGSVKRFQGYAIDSGSVPNNHGNPNTTLITKFSPILNGQADIIGSTQSPEFKIVTMPIIRALQATRKYNS